MVSQTSLQPFAVQLDELVIVESNIFSSSKFFKFEVTQRSRWAVDDSQETSSQVKASFVVYLSLSHLRVAEKTYEVSSEPSKDSA